ncbi:MAG: dihydrofolate reductase [Hyphomonadaceae bacterium]|nr:dihydrofolate reductase [Hyphomonadaceae bacterium]
MSVDPKLSIIVAKSRNGVIGKDGGLPWHLSSDLQYFKKTTLGKPVLMGRVTFESIGRPLPGRPNLVLTRNADFQAKGVEVFTDTHAMIGRGFELAGLSGGDEVMLIGGAQLYASCFEYVSKMYVTEVDAMIEGDAHFPAILAPDWNLISETPYPQGPKDDFPFSVKEFERR